MVAHRFAVFPLRVEITGQRLCGANMQLMTRMALRRSRRITDDGSVCQGLHSPAI